jgi:hypothetical protein
MPSFVQKITITGQQYKTILESISSMVFVGLTSQFNLFYGSYLRSHLPKYGDRLRRKILVSVKARLRTTSEIVEDLMNLSLTWGIGLRHNCNVCTNHNEHVLRLLDKDRATSK